MAAERQKPAQLDWRTPRWGWALAAFALGGPLNPVALGFVVIAFFGRMSGGAVAAGYLLAAGASCVAICVVIASWLAKAPSLQRTVQALAFSVVAMAIGFAIASAVTLAPGVLLDERINLGLAVLTISLLAGGAIAATSVFVFRRVALTSRRKPSSRSRIVRPREVGSA